MWHKDIANVLFLSCDKLTHEKVIYKFNRYLKLRDSWTHLIINLSLTEWKSIVKKPYVSQPSPLVEVEVLMKEFVIDSTASILIAASKQ